MPKIAMVDFVNKVLYVFVLVYLLIDGGNLNSVLAGNALTQGLAFILLLVFLRKYAKLGFAWDFVYWKKVFYISWPLAITVFLNLLYSLANLLLDCQCPSILCKPEYRPGRYFLIASKIPNQYISIKFKDSTSD